MADLSLPVLLVDDYASMRRTIRSMLNQIGFTSIIEDDGSGALSLIHEKDFGLIISDLMMTPVSGLDLLRAVRSDWRTSQTLFVMVTGAAHQDLVVAAKGLKVDGYVVKPFDTNTLRRKLFALLERGSTAPAAVAAGAPSQPPAPAEEKPQSEDSELAALRRAIDALYALLDTRLRAGDGSPNDDLIGLIRSYIERAVALGIESDYRQQLEAMLAQLPAAKSPLQAWPGVLRDRQPLFRTQVVADRRQAKNDAGDERRSSSERRRYKRFAEPALHVTIGDNTYRTKDWSIGGFALAGYSGPLQPDKQIKITLQVEGDDEERRSFEDRVVVVRNDPGTGSLAVKFTSHSSATLKVLEYLTRRRENTVEAARAAAPSGA